MEQRYKNNWKGTTTDLMEIIKGLSEAGYLQGNPTIFFKELCRLFNIQPTNTKDLIKGIRRRKKDKFIVTKKMLQSLEEWNNKLDRRNYILNKVKQWENH